MTIPEKEKVIPSLSVKGVKNFRGMEGMGFNATLYIDKNGEVILNTNIPEGIKL